VVVVLVVVVVVVVLLVVLVVVVVLLLYYSVDTDESGRRHWQAITIQAKVLLVFELLLLLLLQFLRLFLLLLLVVSVVMVMADPRHWAAEGGGREAGATNLVRLSCCGASCFQPGQASTTIPKWRDNT